MQPARAQELISILTERNNPYKDKIPHILYELGYIRGLMARLAAEDSYVAEALIQEYKRTHNLKD